MKRLLAIILTVLISTVQLVALSAAPAAISFDTDITDVPAGTKVVANVGEVTASQSVVAIVNGEESVITPTNGKYAVTIGESWQNVKVQVREGGTVVASTPAVDFYGKALANSVSKANVTWDGFSASSTADDLTKVGIAKVDEHTHITNGFLLFENEGDNSYAHFRGWGTADSDPNYNVEGHTAAADSKSHTLTFLGVFDVNIMEASFDFRIPKLEIIDPETHTVSNTINLASATAEDATYMNYIRKNNIMTYQVVDTGATVRRHLDAFVSQNGKTYANVYDTVNKTSTFVDTGVNAGEWHNYKAIVNVADKKVSYYIDGVFLAEGDLCYVATYESDPTYTATKWPYFMGAQVYNDKNARVYSDIDNIIIKTSTGYIAKGEPSVEFETAFSGNVPAGAKVKANITSSNLKYGQSTAIYVNGVQTTLDGNGTFTVPAGYSSVKAAIVQNGSIVKETDAITFYGVGYDGDASATGAFSADTSNLPLYAEYSTATGSTKNEYNSAFSAAGISDSEYYGNTEYAAFNSKEGATSKVKIDGTDDKYFRATAWGSIYTDPVYTTNKDAARADGGSSLFTSSYRTQDVTSTSYTGARFVDMSVDYRAVSVDTVTVSTGVLEKTKALTSAADIQSEWKWAAWDIMDTQLVWDGDYSGTRGTKGLFGIKNTGKPYARVYNGTDAVDVELDINPTEWHNYRAVIDIEEDCLYLLVDGVLVNKGSCGTNKTSTTNVTEVLWPHVYGPRQYMATTESTTGNWTYNKRITVDFDNWNINAYNGAVAAPTAAFVDITENGVGLVPANLDDSDKIPNMTIIAKANDGSVEIHSYNAESATETYKHFSFAKPAVKVYVWNWSTLKPLTAPLLGAE